MQTAPASPPPTDIPKLPFSVSEIANRYNTGDSTPTSPRRTGSPTLEPLSPRLDPSARPFMMPPFTMLEGRPPLMSSVSSKGSTSFSTGISDEMNRRRQELEDLERREREFALRQREREVDFRTRELELERTRLLVDSRGNHGVVNLGDGYMSDSGRSARSFARTDTSTPGGSLAQGRYSYSTTHLIPPPGSSSTGMRAASSSSQQSQPPSPIPGEPNDHAPFCGCNQCSVAKYRAPPSPQDDLRPVEPPINLRPDKPKNWMRRLSMPVGAAFSLDSPSKKAATTAVSSSNSNRHSTTFVQEDGKFGRKSYDPAVPSVTNLGKR